MTTVNVIGKVRSWWLKHFVKQRGLIQVTAFFGFCFNKRLLNYYKLLNNLLDTDLVQGETLTKHANSTSPEQNVEFKLSDVDHYNVCTEVNIIEAG